MALAFVNANQITPVSSSTDQIIIAETSWGWRDTGVEPGVVLSSATKGEVSQRSGSNWLKRGSITNISGVEAISGTNTVQVGNAVALKASPADGDVYILDATTTLTALNKQSTPVALGEQVKGSVIQYDTSTDGGQVAGWAVRGNLTDLDKVSVLGDIDAGTSFTESPSADDILVFDADTTLISSVSTAAAKGE